MTDSTRISIIISILVMFPIVQGGSLEEADRSYFGVNHGHNFSIMVEGGLLWHRQDFTWNSIEHEKGIFDFEQYDEVVEETAEVGVRILGILDYSAEWASSAPTTWDHARDRAPPKNLEDWSNYVFKTVEHFKGRVSHWEVWNEPNTNFFWLPKKDAQGYTNLLRAAYVAAKQADPQCVVLIGGMIGFGPEDLEYIEEIYSRGGGSYFDVFAWHPYPGDPNPCLDQFNFTEFMAELKGIISRYGDEHKEIWFTEIAWGIGPNTTREDQANYLVRSYVLSFAEGVDRFFWFNFRGPPQEEGSALLDYDFTPRPAFNAHANLAELLSGAIYDREIELKDAHCHSFSKNDERIVFAWVPWDSKDVVLRLKSGVDHIHLSESYGDSLVPEGTGNRLRLTLTESPVIITGLDEADIRSMESSGSNI
ncbi:MAG: glycosyl hydrolase 53 family protein, partial [Theionarchaea archaeon]|nr:glycosyl hydrolase 53 family protein [Theionarchaea archaeon]